MRARARRGYDGGLSKWAGGGVGRGGRERGARRRDDRVPSTEIGLERWANGGDQGGVTARHPRRRARERGVKSELQNQTQPAGGGHARRSSRCFRRQPPPRAYGMSWWAPLATISEGGFLGRERLRGHWGGPPGRARLHRGPASGDPAAGRRRGSVAVANLRWVAEKCRLPTAAAVGWPAAEGAFAIHSSSDRPGCGLVWRGARHY